MADNENVSSLNIAVSVGRIETAVTNLIQGFSDFKSSHKDDINFLTARADRHDERLKALETEAIQRAGGVLTRRTLVEIAVAGASIAYYILELKR